METQSATKPNRARFSLGEIVDVTGSTVEIDRTLCIEGVISDTRANLQGALFVALRGARFDGHTFLQQAKEQGAVAAVVTEDFAGEAPADFPLIKAADTTRALGDIARAHRLRFDIPVIGVTGSYGKTTTRALIVAALGENVLASIANNNNEIGVPQTLLQLDETHRFAVIEMGMRGRGQIAELARIAQPTVGLITNVGPQHIEFFDDIWGVVAAKAELLQALPDNGVAVIPANDGYGATLRGASPPRVVTFGESEIAAYRVVSIEADSYGLRFEVAEPHSVAVHLPLVGAHNALNAVAALAVAGVLEIPLEEAALALATVDVPGARMRVVRAGEITVIDDSYNAGPDSMRAALETLQSYGAKRRIAVLGAMKELGRWSEDEHRKLGETAMWCDELVCVGTETRATQGAARKGLWFASAKEAAPVVKELLRDGDCVLVKGSRSVGLEQVVESITGGAA
jgi:UDP-N-acetylmuramoyl-tripeptide--D-alanyl-D-alanine ligase